MHKHNQAGFAHILMVLIALLVLGAVGFAGYRVMSAEDKSETSSPGQTASSSEADVQLSNFGLESLSSVDVTTQAVREYSSNKLKGFYIFGEKLDATRINPNFEFASLKEDTKVVAAIDGVVAFIKEQSESGDFEVFLQPKDGSAWTVGYDHIVNVAVKQGDKVAAGAVLGKPARQNNGLLRFEIQINKDEAGSTTHHCPSTLLKPSIKDNLLKELSTMQTAWNTTTGLNLYDVSAQDPVGCLSKTLTPDQAEGR